MASVPVVSINPVLVDINEMNMEVSNMYSIIIIYRNSGSIHVHFNFRGLQQTRILKTRNNYTAYLSLVLPVSRWRGRISPTAGSQNIFIYVIATNTRIQEIISVVSLVSISSITPSTCCTLNG